MLSVNFDVASQMAMAMVMANTDNVCEGNEDMFLTISSRVDGVDVCANNRAMIIIRDRSKYTETSIIQHLLIQHSL